jgi:hypothetical protein
LELCVKVTPIGRRLLRTQERRLGLRILVRTLRLRGANKCGLELPCDAPLAPISVTTPSGTTSQQLALAVPCSGPSRFTCTAKLVKDGEVISDVLSTTRQPGKSSVLLKLNDLGTALLAMSGGNGLEASLEVSVSSPSEPLGTLTRLIRLLKTQ